MINEHKQTHQIDLLEIDIGDIAADSITKVLGCTLFYQHFNTLLGRCTISSYVTYHDTN